MNKVAGTEGTYNDSEKKCTKPFDATELTSNDRSDPFSTGGLDPDLVTNMNENLLVAHGNQGQFAEIRVGGEILECVHLD